MFSQSMRTTGQFTFSSPARGTCAQLVTPHGSGQGRECRGSETSVSDASRGCESVRSRNRTEALAGGADVSCCIELELPPRVGGPVVSLCRASRPMEVGKRR